MVHKVQYLLALVLIVNFCVLFLYTFPESSVFLLTSRPYVPEFEDAPSGNWEESQPWRTYLKSLNNENSINGIHIDEDYCEKVREYRKTHPIKFDSKGLPIKEHRVFYTDYYDSEVPRKELKRQGVLVHPNNTMRARKAPRVNMDPSILSYFLHFVSFHESHRIGTSFLCEGQRYNHIPGNKRMWFKDVAIDNMRNYAPYYKGREHCFDPWSIFPFTYNMVHEDQCNEFMDILREETDSDEINWMMKKSRNAHRGSGIYLVDAELRTLLLENFECPSEELYLMQRYIKNPFLINNRKFDFRVYLVIASMDPLIILYRDGFVRLSPEEYDPESKSKNVHLTNTDITLKSLLNRNITESEKKEILDSQSISLKEFEQYMIKTGRVEPGWLEKDVKTFIKWMMFHLVRMSLDKLLKHPGLYELFGLDFLMDTDLHLWFLETNLQPAMVEGNEMKTGVYHKLMEDLINLELALQFGADFDALLAETDFEWIYDGRQPGFERYHDAVSRDCV